MLDFDPFGPAENQESELRYAYGAVLDAMDSPMSSVNYWAGKMEDHCDPPFLPSPSLTLSDTPSLKSEPSEYDLGNAKSGSSSQPRGRVNVKPRDLFSGSDESRVKEESDDEEFQEAIRLSLLEVRKANKRSPPSNFRPDKAKRVRQTPDSLDDMFIPCDIRKALGSANSYDAEGQVRSEPRRPQPQKEDYADEDLSKSKAMVKIYIGQDSSQQPFFIPKSEIDKRPSLSDPKIGCMQPMDDGTTRLDLPCFRSFSPEEFGLVAEFLSTGKFGHPSVSPKNRDRYLDECIRAWMIADKMVLEDLLDLVVVKIQETRPWTLQEVMPLAGMVYEEEGSTLTAYATMKEMTAEAVAENFQAVALEYGEVFWRSFNELPELQRDVYKLLFERAERNIDGK